MANYCAYDMKITGKEDAIKEMAAMLSRQGKYKGAGLGRVYSFEADELEKTSVPNIYSLNASGDCAWSVLCAMQDYCGRYPSLESESERLGLVVEVFSSEPGCCFQEHVLIVGGEVLESECVNYEEHWIDGFDSLDDYNKEYKTDFTEDMINSDGYITVDGYGDDYGVFKDAAAYETFFVNQIEPVQQSESVIKVYFDGIHMDTVYVSENQLDSTINSIARNGYEGYNGDVKEDWEKRMGSDKKPTLSFEVVVFEPGIENKEGRVKPLNEQIRSAEAKAQQNTFENMNKENERDGRC